MNTKYLSEIVSGVRAAINRNWRRLAITTGLVLVVVVGGGWWLTRAAQSRLERQYKALVPNKQRTPAEMRGLVEQLLELRREIVPAFVPQNLWDEEMCDATVVTAVNAIVGTELLKTGPAWLFGRDNAEKLELVFDRSEDFELTTNGGGKPRVVERVNTGFKLSSLLEHRVAAGGGTTDRLYVIGYHYSHTRSDTRIADNREAGGGLNSHVMLLLGRADNKWWGYHMIHTNGDTEYPFKVDDLAEDMPGDFDIVYIWEVKNSRMALRENAARIAFVQNFQPYERVKRYIGWGKLDKPLVEIFGDTDQFPRVVKFEAGIVEVVTEEHPSLPRGAILGFYDGVAVHNNGGKSKRGPFGLEFECVELVNRFLVRSFGHKNLTRTGNADSYFWQADSKKLHGFGNNNEWPPAVNDILVFDPDGLGGNPGHVAVVTSVVANNGKGEVCMVQQNATPWHTCLSLAKVNGKWQVDQFNDNLPCVGWARTANPPLTKSVEETPVARVEIKPAPTANILRRVTLLRGDNKTVRQRVLETPRANLSATFACNEWPIEKESSFRIYPHQVFRICGPND